MLRLLLVYEDDLLYEPTAAEVRHGMQVINPMPKAILVTLSGMCAAVSAMSGTLTVSVAPPSPAGRAR